MAKIEGGASELVEVTTDESLVGTRYVTPVYGFPNAERGIVQGSGPSLVYVVSDAQIASGKYKLMGGAAESVTDIATGRVGSGGGAIPVYLVGGSLAGAGGAAVPSKTYELLDQFITTESAPMASPRTAEPGPGTLTLTDASNIMSIAAGALVVNGTPAADSQVRTAAISPLAGKVFSVDVNATTSYLIYQLHNATAFSLSPKYSVLINSTGPAIDIRDEVNNVGVLAPMVDTPLSGTYSIVYRENGGFFFFKDTDLIWVTFSRTEYATMYGGPFFYQTLAQNLSLDNLELYTPSTDGLSTEYGIATNVVPLPSNNEIIAGDADGLYRILWTPQTNEVLTFLFRRIDDANTMKLVCDQAAGTIKLYTRTAGVDTEIDAGKTQTWTVATQFTITIQTWGTKIQTRANHFIKHNTTSAVNQTETGLKVSSDAATPNINEFVAWPRSLPDFPFV